MCCSVMLLCMVFLAVMRQWSVLSLDPRPGIRCHYKLWSVKLVFIVAAEAACDLA